MRSLAAFAVVAAAGVSASTQVPRAWIAVGPIAVGEMRTAVEAVLGKAGSCYPTQPRASCYTDGSAYLSIGYDADGRVHDVTVAETPPSMPGRTTRVPRSVRFATWRLDRQPVLAGRFVPEKTWRTASSGGGVRSYAFADFRIDHGTGRSGTFTAVTSTSVDR